MARRSWDDRWQRYPESVPLPAAEGLATSKQRGRGEGHLLWQEGQLILVDERLLGEAAQP